jgi:sugar phosphate isomerase/epimerase
VGRRVHLIETIPGRGGIDYRAYLQAIASLSQAAPLMLEHLSLPEEYDEGRQYILRVAGEVGISFA